MKRFIMFACLCFMAACQSTDQNSFVPIDRGTFDTFTRSLNSRSYAYQVMQDPTAMAPTRLIERFELRSGDCGADSGWNDCATDRERVELSQRGIRIPAGSREWYSWWIYFPDDYSVAYPAKTTLGQFHQQSSHPVWMFGMHRDGSYVLDEKVLGVARQRYPLIGPRDLRGKWHKIEVFAHWSKKADGQFSVWVNGQEKLNYSGQTMTATRVYFKYGIYRSFISRYKEETGIPVLPTQVVYYAGVRRADTREELQFKY
ncbi:hypothetical protein HAT86_15625 [Roseovarius gahaiensis]|uniref:Polysaccharide lyase n=1 Tax=Roseovarius gahaiensis TaxID=2716691 RepID=A0A967BEQ2_9RHOB|nr:heparin lyase I family protein [Roseovarius gahaiensis]NHQ75879.1 hypothetical protein [Roseovarius gahaiensis]